MFGAPIGNLCVNEPKNENVEVRETFADATSAPKINGETTLTELCSMKDYNEELAVKNFSPEDEPEDEPEDGPEDGVEVGPEVVPGEEVEDGPGEEVEEFGNRVVFGQRFLSLDLALRAVLYALLFYIVSHKDTQSLLKGVVNVLPKIVKPFTPMVLFGLLYYVLNLFI